MPYNERAGKRYTETEQTAALELAATIGPVAAARELDIGRKTIYRWMEKHPKLWSDLRAGDPAAHKRKVAGRLEDLADRYRGAEHDLLDRVEEDLIPKITDPKEAAALIKAMGSSRMTAIAGARTVSGEPEQVEHTINFPALEAAMERILEAAPTPPVIETTVEAIEA